MLSIEFNKTPIRVKGETKMSMTIPWISVERMNYHTIRMARRRRFEKRVNMLMSVQNMIFDSRLKTTRDRYWIGTEICEYDGTIVGVAPDQVYDLLIIPKLIEMYQPTLQKKLWSRKYKISRNKTRCRIPINAQDMKQIHRDIISESRNKRLAKRRYKI